MNITDDEMYSDVLFKKVYSAYATTKGAWINTFIRQGLTEEQARQKFHTMLDNWVDNYKLEEFDERVTTIAITVGVTTVSRKYDVNDPIFSIKDESKRSIKMIADAQRDLILEMDKSVAIPHTIRG